MKNGWPSADAYASLAGHQLSPPEALNFLSLFVAVLLMWLISRCKRGYRVLVPKKSGGGRLGPALAVERF